MSYLTITGGSANTVGGAQDGGGIDNFGTLTVSNSTLTGNSGIDGGGIANELGATLNLVASTVANNTATSGGGVYNAGNLSMTNSTVADNTASIQGGGVLTTGTLQPSGLVTGGVLTVVNSTIAYNRPRPLPSRAPAWRSAREPRRSPASPFRRPTSAASLDL
jgi:hypothetical protein